MPFPPQKPTPFNKVSVEKIRPGQIGCYGLFRQERCVYIGKGDIRACLLSHLNGDNTCIARHSPTHWLGSVAPDVDGEERRLIREFKPECNQKSAAAS